jgi:hypothetical protein
MSGFNPLNLWIIFRNQLMPVSKVMKIIFSEDNEREE